MGHLNTTNLQKNTSLRKIKNPQTRAGSQITYFYPKPLYIAGTLIDVEFTLLKEPAVELSSQTSNLFYYLATLSILSLITLLYLQLTHDNINGSDVTVHILTGAWHLSGDPSTNIQIVKLLDYTII
jgi:hypothetical protein